MNIETGTNTSHLTQTIPQLVDTPPASGTPRGSGSNVWGGRMKTTVLHGHDKALPTHMTHCPPKEQDQPGTQAEQNKNIYIAAAEAALGTFAHLPVDKRKITLQLMVTLHNDSVTNPVDQLPLACEDVAFKIQFPKLNRLIENQLGFFQYYKHFSEFAFVNGYFNDLLQTRDNFPENRTMAICEFFRNYFLKEGTDQGKSNILQFIEKYSSADAEQLKEALNHMDLESILGSSPSTECSPLNYQIVFQEVVCKMLLNDQKKFSFLNPLGFSFDDYDKIECAFSNKDPRFILMTLLDKFVRKGIDTPEGHRPVNISDLINILYKASMIRIASNLEKKYVVEATSAGRLQADTKFGN